MEVVQAVRGEVLSSLQRRILAASLDRLFFIDYEQQILAGMN